MVKITHIRTQWPVGQGFFHTGSFYEDGALKFTYVYDCGSRSIPKLHGLVDDFADMIAKRRVVDLLFVSHLHADHVAGLDRLREKKFKIQRVILPMFDKVDMAIAIGRMPSAPREGVAEYFADPGGFISRGGGDASETIVYTMEPGGDTPPEEPGPGDVEGELTWEITGLPDGRGTGVHLPAGTVLKTMGRLGWVFLPYCMREDAQRRKFQALVEAKLGRPTSGMTIDYLVGNHAVLKRCYREIGSLHGSNLFTYSGFGRYGGHEIITSRCRRMPRSCCRDHYCPWRERSRKSGWLGTGDGEMRTDFKKFQHFYKDYLDKVRTLTLPHHGSRHNISFEALRNIDAEIAVVSYGNNDYGHPSRDVLAQCAGLCMDVVEVTGKASSAFQEGIFIH